MSAGSPLISNRMLFSLISFTLFVSGVYVIIIVNAIESNVYNSQTLCPSKEPIPIITFRTIPDSNITIIDTVHKQITSLNTNDTAQELGLHHPDPFIPHKPQKPHYIQNVIDRNKPKHQDLHQISNNQHTINVKNRTKNNKNGHINFHKHAHQGEIHKFCNAILPKKPIFSMVHHKTGHDLSWSIGGVLRRYCRHLLFKSEFSINGFINTCRPAKTPNKCIYVHWVRHPLNTIVSGFYYHLKTDEEWVNEWIISDSVNTAIDMDMNALYHDIIHNETKIDNYYKKYRKERVIRASGTGKQRLLSKKRQMSQLLLCFDVSEKSILYEYVHEFMENYIMNKDDAERYLIGSDINANITMLRFYNILKGKDYKIGLFWEFVRFFNCEWPSIYVLQEIGERYFNNVIKFDVDDLMRREGGFDDGMNKLLDGLEMIENEENHKKLEAHKVMSTNINIQRDILMDRLSELDVTRNKSSGHKSKKSKEHLKMHITHNSYHLDQVSHDLLTLDRNICRLIKNMTQLLLFEWGYHHYC